MSQLQRAGAVTCTMLADTLIEQPYDDLSAAFFRSNADGQNGRDQLGMRPLFSE